MSTCIMSCLSFNFALVGKTEISGSSLLSCYHDKLCTCASYWTQCSWSCPPWPSCCPWWPAPDFEGCESSSGAPQGTARVRTQPVPLPPLQGWWKLLPPQVLPVVVLPETPLCSPCPRFVTWLWRTALSCFSSADGNVPWPLHLLSFQNQVPQPDDVWKICVADLSFIFSIHEPTIRKCSNQMNHDSWVTEEIL